MLEELALTALVRVLFVGNRGDNPVSAIVEAKNINIIRNEGVLLRVEAAKNHNKLVNYYCGVGQTGFKLLFYFFAGHTALDLEWWIDRLPRPQESVEYPDIRKWFLLRFDRIFGGIH